MRMNRIKHALRFAGCAVCYAVASMWLLFGR